MRKQIITPNPKSQNTSQTPLITYKLMANILRETPATRSVVATTMAVLLLPSQQVAQPPNNTTEASLCPMAASVAAAELAAELA